VLRMKRELSKSVQDGWYPPEASQRESAALGLAFPLEREWRSSIDGECRH
jgi:hypothetical protein